MNRIKSFARKSTLAIIAAVCCFAFNGCTYDVPITPKPTRKIDERLLGNWISKDGKDKMKVVKLDDSDYIVTTENDPYRVYHSDVAGTPFVSVQKLESTKPQYFYWTWKLSADGTLSLRCVNDKIVPDDTKDSASVQKLLKKNLQNPALFGDEKEESLWTKDKDK